MPATEQSEARESAGLTQVQLGRALGVPQQDLSRAEAGFSAVRVLEAIRHALEEGAPAERPLGRGGRPRAT